MGEPPKDRHFLCRQYTFHWNRYKWEHVGYEWKEAYWDGTTYRIWAGTDQTTTTEHAHFKAWAELPNRVHVMATEVIQ